MKLFSSFISILVLLFLAGPQANGGSKQLFKIASLAPAGSVWTTQFENFAEEVREKTGGEVDFRIYPGGVMGDDIAMFRKMRVGQLHGGGFTMTGVASQVPDFRILGIPFLFHSYEEIDFVKKGLLPEFEKQFRDKGLELIAMTEVGFVYAMSTLPISDLETFKQSKNWAPTGDPVSEKFLQTLGITPIQLIIPDVLSSLQSGLVETVYNSFYGSIVLQWFTKTKYIVDLPYGYAYGVFVVSSQKFNKLTEKQKQVFLAAAHKHFPVLLKKTRQSNQESRLILKQRGGQFLTLDHGTIELLKEKRNETIKQLVPDAFSKSIQDHTFKLLEEFRKQ
ncbi:TRAP transporter substrate-binding protein [Desulforhopalus singaporensis]|uniref:TRAP-type C4-dicarboxylate transport system, substrate-binding protein n=1 Tax=Desulforhopalus singaporensis TaxID=91360 RepID=A0A1H0TU27_9BACT|nr:TRAP transporter substrate-binding protein DctP [Desulforhopalus singaporensis]SDP57240.1 TRAP-type C4-dicarboxylate transport system, substrate-binding protein [Desulforhopalus singaporensis]